MKYEKSIQRDRQARNQSDQELVKSVHALGRADSKTRERRKRDPAEPHGERERGQLHDRVRNIIQRCSSRISRDGCQKKNITMPPQKVIHYCVDPEDRAERHKWAHRLGRCAPEKNMTRDQDIARNLPEPRHGKEQE